MPQPTHTNNVIELHIETSCFNVLKLTGVEALATPFRFELEVLASYDFIIDHHLLKPAAIYSHYGRYQRFIVGMITRITAVPIDATGQQRICFVVESRLVLLAKRQRERRLYNQSYPQVIKKLLCQHGYQSKQIKFHVSKPQHSEQQHCIVQYHAETDLDFLHRIIAQQGLFYWLSCDRQAGQEIIHFADANKHLPWFPDVVGDVPASELSTTQPGLVTLTSHGQYHAHHYRVIGHDAAFPTHLIHARYQREPHATLTQVSYEADVKNAQQAQQRAILLAEQGCQYQQRLSAGSNVPQFAAGLCVNFCGHGCYQALNGAYVINQVQHYAEQPVEHFGKQLDYHNQLWMISQVVPYRCERTSRSTPRACVQATVKSSITTPELDHQGRYRLHFRCNHTNATTEWMPRLTHSGGVVQWFAGVHTPLYNDVEVLTGFLNGDAEQAVILGAMSKSLSPVTANDATQHHFVSRSQHELRMDCQPDRSRMSLRSSRQGTELDMLTNTDHAITALRATQGAIHIEAGHYFYERSGYLVERVNRHRLLHAGRHYHMRIGRKMRLQAAGGVDVDAVENISFKVTKKLIFKAATDMLLHSKQSVQIKSQRGTIRLDAQCGDVVCSAEKGIRLIGCGQGDIILQQGNSELRITAKQGIYMQGAVQYHTFADEL